MREKYVLEQVNDYKPDPITHLVELSLSGDRADLEGCKRASSLFPVSRYMFRSLDGTEGRMFYKSVIRSPQQSWYLTVHILCNGWVQTPAHLQRYHFFHFKRIKGFINWRGRIIHSFDFGVVFIFEPSFSFTRCRYFIECGQVAQQHDCDNSNSTPLRELERNRM